MGIRTELARIILTPEHISSATQRSHDVAALLRSTQLRLSETIRDIEAIASVCPADDPNMPIFKAQIEALQ